MTKKIQKFIKYSALLAFGAVVGQGLLAFSALLQNYTSENQRTEAKIRLYQKAVSDCSASLCQSPFH
ncbi:MAG: hypothetical protein ABJM58_12310 [Alteripontixanthobacter sp.]